MMLRRFEREAQATAALRSPHTVELYDFGIARDGTFYYVMELLDGVDLDTLVRRDGPQPPERVVRILRQACHSLHEAHTRGLVHQDIKPANLYLCRYGAELDFVKLLDFGLVREYRAASESQPEGGEEMSGTPAFMAPEVIMGKIAADGRADIYGLGGVGYWLLTGELLFHRASLPALLAAHALEAPIPVSSRAKQPVPEGLASLVMRCLEKDPARRPTAAALSAALGVLGLESAWTEARAAAWWDRPDHG
jgi:serine/threonine-protein kinase